MTPAPRTIDGADVLYSTPIDDRHCPTGACRHFVAGVLQGPAAGLAICRYANDAGFYLLYCDAAWNCVTDTWHATLDKALAQAEAEYAGTAATWRRHEAPCASDEATRHGE